MAGTSLYQFHFLSSPLLGTSRRLPPLAIIGNILEQLDAGGSGMTMLPTEHLFLSYRDTPTDSLMANKSGVV